MKYCIITLLLFLQACAHSSGSFLDTFFGPLEETHRKETTDKNKHIAANTNRYQQQFDTTAEQQQRLTTSDPGFIKIPDKDYVGDLDGSSGIGPVYAGIVTFGHLPLSDCFEIHLGGDTNLEFDIAVVGAPFDTATTYRPGARFGPSGIREGSRRIDAANYLSPFRPIDESYDDFKVVECGDVAMSSFDNRYALDQLYRGHRAILNHSVLNFNKDNEATKVPKILTLGGDHTITFSALRAVSEKHGAVSVLHFDSHIDTWEPEVLGGNISSYQQLNHGTFLHYAIEKGYAKKHGANTHVGIRSPFLRRYKDHEHDRSCGFEIIFARDIDELGIKGVIRKIKDRIGAEKVYITVDIDSLDPVYAPGTGTAEPGGFTTRELLTILDGLSGLNVVGADIVEVAPAYDDRGQVTVLAAAEVAMSLIELMKS